MPDAVAEAVEASAVLAAAQAPCFIEVRDVADLGQREPPLATLGRRPAETLTADVSRHPEADVACAAVRSVGAA